MKILEARANFPALGSSRAAFDNLLTRARAFTERAHQIGGPSKERATGIMAGYEEIRLKVDQVVGAWTLAAAEDIDLECLKRMMVTALLLLCMRQADIGILLHVRILYSLAGGWLIRAGNGCAYQYNTRLGSWDAYNGLVYEPILDQIHMMLLRVEGFFRGATAWHCAHGGGSPGRVLESGGTV